MYIALFDLMSYPPMQCPLVPAPEHLFLTRISFLRFLTAQVYHALPRLGAICFGFHPTRPIKGPRNGCHCPLPPATPAPRSHFSP